LLRAKPAKKATLTILRPSTKEIKDYVLERAEVKVQSVKNAHLIDQELTGPFKVGYIRIVQFNEPTVEELARALDDLQKRGMQALILDLRNNPGGLPRAARRRRNASTPLPSRRKSDRVFRSQSWSMKAVPAAPRSSRVRSRT
jgi:carboxyl-terminal processing protease